MNPDYTDKAVRDDLRVGLKLGLCTVYVEGMLDALDAMQAERDEARARVAALERLTADEVTR